LYEDFRGAGPLPPTLVLHPVQGTRVGRDEEGLRITAPANGPPTGGVNLVLRLDLKGDFEITAGYELLAVDPPRDGHGVGFHLEFTTATARRANCSVSRITRVNEGDVYWFARMTTDDDGHDQYEQNHVETTARSGQLRLTRIGPEVTAYAADGPAGAFQKLFDHEIDREDLRTVKLTAFQGWGHNGLDLRMKDLRVRSLNTAEARQVVAATAASGPERSYAWLLLSLALLSVLMVLLGLWLFGRRRRPRQSSIPGDESEPPTAAGAATVPVTFACPGCGKQLRARPALAGKRVRCPECGNPALVPSIQA
jgi:hypothetical protein